MENAPAYEIKYLFDEISEAEVEQAIAETTVAIGDWGHEHFYPMFDIRMGENSEIALGVSRAPDCAGNRG
ncbi:hypothetical protein A7Q01_08655 [Eikenella sp. NML96-A-049]|nr:MULTISPECIES: hypothetical protein [unclassified Eikenella]OAM30227.1 hypothetical protein A7P96_06270 [Eikenella sp. NML03-A-027]OAM34712.1 hypothetical protein A7P97_06000 [Eikenella sp. NML070372]OAM39452.1 hypothetical protein A7Q01_08655 [Eikenella sp. NML96-A-049]